MERAVTLVRKGFLDDDVIFMLT